MTSLSTHVLDAARGGARVGVVVTLEDETGKVLASGSTGEDGRIAPVATDLVPGRYRLTFSTDGDVVAAVTATLDLIEDRHYHVPLLASPVAAVVYLGV